MGIVKKVSIAVFVLILLAIVLGANQEPVKVNTTGESTPKSQNIQEIYSLGDTVRYNSIEFTVLDYQFREEPYTYTISGIPDVARPKSGYKFLFLKVRAKNVGERSKYSPTIDEIVVVARGNQYEADFMAGYPKDMKEYEAKDLLPGVSEEGWLRFEVPEDINATEITVVADLSGWGEKLVRWKLE